MKRFIVLGLLLPVLALSCVTKKDFDERFDSMEARVSELEKQVERLNNEVKTINLLISGKYFVESVSDLEDGSGYKLTLVDVYGKKTEKTVHNGVSPLLGVALFTDGEYYWTVNGEWLLNNGQKVRANGLSPEFKVSDGSWYVSYDGKSWTYVGSAVTEAVSLVQSIKADEAAGIVTVTLSDGSVFTVPLASAALFLRLEMDEKAFVGMEPGETRTTRYAVTVPDGVKDYSLDYFESDGLTVFISKPDENAGYIMVTLNEGTNGGKVIIVLSASNGSSYSVVLHVGEEDSSITKFSIPGIYLSDGSARFYIRCSDQYCREWDGTALTFALLNVRTEEALTVIGYDSSMTEGDPVTVSATWTRGGTTILDSSYNFSVLKDEGGIVWLGDEAGNGIILKK